jgi:hypothetical protein
MKLKNLPVFLVLLLLVSCRSTQNSTTSKSSANDKLLTAVSWYQHSAEMTALYYLMKQLLQAPPANRLQLLLILMKLCLITVHSKQL